MKKISVIIPCYNVAKYLPQCFLSLAQQTIGIENLELIFVNDASTDGGATWSLLQEIERAYPEDIMVIDLEENMRQGGARNVALQYASGEYISFVDADDWVELDYYETVYHAAKEKNADIVQFGHKMYADSLGIIEAVGKRFEPAEISVETVEQRKQLLMAEKLTYGCTNKLYRRELIERAGVRYAEHVVYEEPLFVYPLLFYANKFVILDRQFYYYRQNFAGTSHASMKVESTLLQHAQVQLQTWEFMKQTPYYETYKAEIDFYFFHTFMYETLRFGAARGMRFSLEVYRELRNVIRESLGFPVENIYFSKYKSQKELTEILEKEITQEQLDGYIENLR